MDRKGVHEAFEYAYKIDFLQNSLESATLVPNKTRLKPSFPRFSKSLIKKFMHNLGSLEVYPPSFKKTRGKKKIKE